jgi:hypothetical protein
VESREPLVHFTLFWLSFFLFLLLRPKAFGIGWTALVWQPNVLFNPTSQIDQFAAFTAKRRCLGFVEKKPLPAGTAGQRTWIVTQSISRTVHVWTFARLHRFDIRPLSSLLAT